MVKMNFDMSKPDAYKALELPLGADSDSIQHNYCRLATKWHPENNENRRDAIKKFQEVSMAYFKLLSNGGSGALLTYPQMLRLYQEVISPREAYSNGYHSSDDEDSDDEDEDEIHERLHQSHQTNGASVNGHLDAEELETNANELLTEEEKERRKAEKRRAKKKRRREKKRLEKLEQAKKEIEVKKKPAETSERIKSKRNKKNEDSSESEEEFDPQAAFFTQVVSKKKRVGVVGISTADPLSSSKPKGSTAVESRTTTVRGTDPEEPEDMDLILRSRQLAIRGNEMANSGHYSAAIDLFTEAIQLDPVDFRFLGNRSYCYDRIHQYEKALKDADRAVSLSPDWAKGYFRKGRALAGLKLFADAEQAFTQVLKLDRNCEDALHELRRVRTHQLTEMGFSKQQAERAIRSHDSVPQALESLLANAVEKTSLTGDEYVSDEDDYVSPPNQGESALHPLLTQSPSHHASLASRLPTASLSSNSMPSDIKLDPRNPEGLTALWVGNVLPEVSSKTLEAMFSKFGTVTSVRCLPEKFCAFVNFKSKDSAGRAMQALQGAECGGQYLKIKFPDNPVVGNVLLKKNKNINSGSPVHMGEGKVTGPVNGNECYFWRTTGCQFGKTCHYLHIPEHKGIDRKPWQRTK